jgi:23S rRNA pseudouridine1911/1915/1917 synthase
MNRIIYEDNHLIAVTKRSGEIVQGDKTGDKPLSEEIKSYLKTKYKKPGNVFLGTIHRLDRPTSGIVLFAKTSKSLSRMNELFKNKKVQKTYFAVTEDKPNKEKGVIISLLKKNQKQNKSYITKLDDGKKSELEYELIEKLQNYFLIKVKPKTGRHHQIRVQLSSIGCKIKGDVKYGAKRANKDKSICLHSYSISFVHPVKNELINLKCDFPKNDIWKFTSL